MLDFIAVAAHMLIKYTTSIQEVWDRPWPPEQLQIKRLVFITILAVFYVCIYHAVSVHLLCLCSFKCTLAFCLQIIRLVVGLIFELLTGFVCFAVIVSAVI